MMADPGIEAQNPSRPGRTLLTNLARGTNASPGPDRAGKHVKLHRLRRRTAKQHAVSRRGTVRSRSGSCGRSLRLRKARDGGAANVFHAGGPVLPYGRIACAVGILNWLHRDQHEL
jgi:hypothetical protein